MRDFLLDKIQKKGDLPPLPEILNRLKQKIEDPDTNIADVAELIHTEPVLSGRLMKLANSVFFSGGRDSAMDLDAAIARLGLKMVLDLAYTVELPKVFVKAKGIKQMRFWHHALAVAVGARSLSKRMDLPLDIQINSYMAGLMHDVGIVVFAYLIPDDYDEFLNKIKGVEKPLEYLENEAFGIAHPELGAGFIEKWWPVAPMVVEGVRRHHEPFKESEFKSIVLANWVVNDQGLTNGTNAFAPPLPDNLEKTTGLSAADIEAAVDDVQDAINQAQSLLAI